MTIYLFCLGPLGQAAFRGGHGETWAKLDWSSPGFCSDSPVCVILVLDCIISKRGNDMFWYFKTDIWAFT